MKRLQKKLRATRGETLIETLVALLVVVMSSMLLLTMTSSTARLNKIAMAEDAILFNEVDTAQLKSADTGLSGQLTVTVASWPILPDGADGAAGRATSVSVPVKWYGNIGRIQSYQLEEGGGGA